MAIKDGNWELVDYDFRSGRSVWSYFDGEKQHFRTDYPVDGLISENSAVRNIAERSWRGDYHRVASIPLNVLWDSGLVEAQSQGDDKFVSRWLNDGDHRAWRTKEGRV